jgi:adenine-specific DNA methylase
MISEVMMTIRLGDQKFRMNNRRLIEGAFPLKQTSLDSVHENKVHHGHISTLYISRARHPLAVCCAGFVATLLPDPEDHEERRCMGGRAWSGIRLGK